MNKNSLVEPKKGEAEKKEKQGSETVRAWMCFLMKGGSEAICV